MLAFLTKKNDSNVRTSSSTENYVEFFEFVLKVPLRTGIHYK